MRGEGALWPPPNFLVSTSITIKFSVLIGLNEVSPKIANNFENDVTAEL